MCSDIENGKNVRCRTCLMTEKNHLNTRLNEVCFNGDTIKEIVLRMVPDLSIPVNENDIICDRCLNTLYDILRFKARCLEVDEMSKNELKRPQNKEDRDLLSTEEQIQEQDMDSKNSASLIIREVDDCEIKYNNEVNISDEEKYFKEISSICSRRMRFKSFPKAMFLSDRIKQHERVVSVHKLKDQVAEDFLFGVGQNLEIMWNSAASERGHKRILLLGNVKKTVCCKCNMECSSEKGLQEHFERAHSDLSEGHFMKPLKRVPCVTSLHCDICRQLFDSFDKKQRHMKKCRMFMCQYCDEPMAQRTMRRHMKEKHDDPVPFQCSKCKGMFRNYNSLLFHVCTRRVCSKCGEKLIRNKSHKCDYQKCSLCELIVPNKLYRDHIQGLHKDSSCGYCGKLFTEIKKLEEHKAMHSEKTLCPVCGKMLTKSNFMMHMKLHRNSNPSAICEVCGKMFVTEHLLKKHVKMTHAKQKVMCELCGKVFGSSSLRAHFLLKHSNKQNKFCCPVCSREFLRKDYFLKHVALHSGMPESQNRQWQGNGKKKYHFLHEDNPVSCKFCLKSYKNGYYLKKHMSIHAKLSRLKCRYCNNTYANYPGRLRHEKMHENPKYKFRCNVCWKIMSDELALVTHEATHQSQNYNCGTCGEHFSRKHQYYSHALKHVSDQEVFEERQLIREALDNGMSDKPEPKNTV